MWHSLCFICAQSGASHPPFSRPYAFPNLQYHACHRACDVRQAISVLPRKPSSVFSPNDRTRKRPPSTHLSVTPLTPPSSPPPPSAPSLNCRTGRNVECVHESLFWSVHTALGGSVWIAHSHVRARAECHHCRLRPKGGRMHSCVLRMIEKTCAITRDSRASAMVLSACLCVSNRWPHFADIAFSVTRRATHSAPDTSSAHYPIRFTGKLHCTLVCPLCLTIHTAYSNEAVYIAKNTLRQYSSVSVNRSGKFFYVPQRTQKWIHTHTRLERRVDDIDVGT